MRILITNDDGITAPIIAALAQKLSKIAEVTVVAPKHEQSGRSQSIDFRHKIEIVPFYLGEGIEAYSMDSTPADCVRFGVAGLGKTYDLVVSGINCGYNLGNDIAYSGTIGAILEGARLGMRGMALSGDDKHLFEALESLDTVFEFIDKNKLFDHASLLNINIPPIIKGFSITRQGGDYFSDDFEKCGDNLYIQIGEPPTDPPTDPSIDIDAVALSLISVTPLTHIRTDLNAFEKLKSL